MRSQTNYILQHGNSQINNVIEVCDSFKKVYTIVVMEAFLMYFRAIISKQAVAKH